MLLDEIKLPVQERSKQRLKQVIDTTIEMIEKNGIENCSIPNIAISSNLPKTFIYQYFPTINHLFIILVKRYLDALQHYVVFKSKTYENQTIYKILKDLIHSVAGFYNGNKAASILILGGPVHVDGFSLQEVVIEKISHDLLIIVSQNTQPLKLSSPEQMTYLVEMVFALMKHSFYKYQFITEEIQNEAILICDLYLQHKNHKIH